MLLPAAFYTQRHELKEKNREKLNKFKIPNTADKDR